MLWLGSHGRNLADVVDVGSEGRRSPPSVSALTHLVCAKRATHNIYVISELCPYTVIEKLQM